MIEIKLKKVIKILFATLVIIVVAIAGFNWLVEKIFEVDEGYVVSIPIDISKTGATYSFQVPVEMGSLKAEIGFSGKIHDFRERYSGVSQYPAYDLRLELACFDKQELTIHWILGESYSPYLSVTDGFTFRYASVPQEVPESRNLRCTVQILEADPKLLEFYGPVRFVFGKDASL